MCGIFGCLGKDSKDKTMEALRKLEYRGYDSAGIAVSAGKGIFIAKTEGRVEKLAQKAENLPATDGAAVGHTRWATHGAATEENAHPFLSYDGHFALVHNGVIENFKDVKAELTQSGVPFASETDSEVIVHLIAEKYRGNMVRCLVNVAKRLQGSFAVAVLSDAGDALYAMRRGSPLYVGKGKEGFCLCSDVNTLRCFCTDIAAFPENCVAEIGENCRVFDAAGRETALRFLRNKELREEQTGTGEAMLREIYEIPRRLRESFAAYYRSGGIGLSPDFLRQMERVYFVGCGTAYHSGVVACGYMRRFTDMDAQAVLASEYIYDNYVTDGNTLVVAITQSGETADTLQAVRKAKERGAVIYAVTNAVNGTVCFLSDFVKQVCAGPEIAVASTKAYNCQVLTLLLLALDVAEARRTMTASEKEKYLYAFGEVPGAVEKVLNDPSVAKTVERFRNAKSVFFIGRREDLPTAQEGSLKLKEISYLHSEAYAAGELKHGTLALMEQGVLVVLIATQKDLADKCRTAASEVVSRHADLLVLSPFGGFEQAHVLLPLPTVEEVYYPVLSVVPLQLLAYHFAKLRGCDVDKPRNLAKSVTVE